MRRVATIRGSMAGLWAPALVVLGGCASAAPLPPVSAAEASRMAAALESNSGLDAPYQLVFDWSLTEPGARLRGFGVARVEPPFRARLDLFLTNSERVAVASLVGDDMLVLAGSRTDLPPAPLLWATLGEFRPGAVAMLEDGRRDASGRGELTYGLTGGDPRTDGADVRYRLDGGRIESVDLLRGNRVREELRLIQQEGERFPSHATYRHLADVRELEITLDTVERVDPFPAEIWDPS